MAYQKREQERKKLLNETEDQRQNRLTKMPKQDRKKLLNETEDQRQNRLTKIQQQERNSCQHHCQSQPKYDTGEPKYNADETKYDAGEPKNVALSCVTNSNRHLIQTPKSTTQNIVYREVQ